MFANDGCTEPVETTKVEGEIDLGVLLVSPREDTSGAVEVLLVFIDHEVDEGEEQGLQWTAVRQGSSGKNEQVEEDNCSETDDSGDDIVDSEQIVRDRGALTGASEGAIARSKLQVTILPILCARCGSITKIDISLKVFRVIESTKEAKVSHHFGSM